MPVKFGPFVLCPLIGVCLFSFFETSGVRLFTVIVEMVTHRSVASSMFNKSHVMLDFKAQ